MSEENDRDAISLAVESRHFDVTRITVGWRQVNDGDDTHVSRSFVNGCCEHNPHNIYFTQLRLQPVEGYHPLTDFILHGSNFKIDGFKCHTPPVHQSKRMGSCVENSFATTSCSPDEGQSRMNRRSARPGLVPILNQSTDGGDVQQLYAASRRSLGCI